MRRRLVGLGAAAVLGGAALGAALAAEPGSPAPLAVRSETRRRYLWISAEGALGSASIAGELRARVRRGDAVALETPVPAPIAGTVRAELVTTARLLPDEYELELVSGGAVVARGPLRVGSPDEVAPARARLRSWLVGARRALRDLAAGLERRGRYHRAQLLEPGGGRPPVAVLEAQRAAWSSALERLAGRLRGARMDYAQYEREVLLTPFPEASAELAALFRAIAERRARLDQAFLAAARGDAGELEPPSEILDLAKRSAAALGLPVDATGDLWAWRAGALGEPEALAPANGRVASRLGFSLALGADWKLEPSRTSATDDASERLRLEGPEGARGRVRVRDVPEAPAWSDLAALVPVNLWEEWGQSSFKRLSVKEGERSYRLDALVVQGGETKRLVTIARGPEHGRRSFELQVLVPDAAWSKVEATVNALAASFDVDAALRPEAEGER